jgi:Tol biopolymer transport system component
VELHSVDLPDESYYSSPRWSPDGASIAFRLSDSASPTARYAVYDLAARSIVAESPPMPQYDPRYGGRCGGGEMFGLAWSRDGRSISYAFSMGDKGSNGIHSWHIDSSEESLSSTSGGSPPSAGPDGLLAFASSPYGDSYIFVASTDGDMPVLLTSGGSPVWSPR